MTENYVEKVKITHCLFDMDGLLLDTESFYTDVQQAIVSRWGKQFTWELKAKMMGQKALAAAQILVQELDIPMSAEEFLAEREAALDALFPTAKLLPGAERLLRHLHRHAIPFCLATSSHQRHYLLKTSSHGELFELFSHRVTGCQVEKGKPHPEIFQCAASRWDPAPAPSSCLVFEDAPSGVAAAKAAGMHCVMVPDARLDLTALTPEQQPDVVLRSLLEFRPERWGLPPFDD